MTVITARLGWLKQSIGTFRPIPTTEHSVSSQVLVTDPLSYQVERITLEIITQSILYTDARRGIMPQRSGGLASTKNLTQKTENKKQKTKNKKAAVFASTHCIPTRQGNVGPRSVTCKFIRKIVKEEAINLKKEASKVSALSIGLSAECSLRDVKIFDHLTPQTQKPRELTYIG